jgi:hypothetical protein
MPDDHEENAMTEPAQHLPPRRLRMIPLHWIEVRSVGREDTPALPGYLCESCLDAPAIALVPAPWGGEMGLCQDCQQRQVEARDEDA